MSLPPLHTVNKSHIENYNYLFSYMINVRWVEPLIRSQQILNLFIDL